MNKENQDMKAYNELINLWIIRNYDTVEIVYFYNYIFITIYVYISIILLFAFL